MNLRASWTKAKEAVRTRTSKRSSEDRGNDTSTTLKKKGYAEIKVWHVPPATAPTGVASRITSTCVYAYYGSAVANVADCSACFSARVLAAPRKRILWVCYVGRT